jgi:DNA invertase Pin-like site-specific DNA recombinase
VNIYEYTRLSKDDGDDEISDSIVNQFLIIDRFIAEKSEFLGANIVKMSDDDHTGINLKRPAMSELLTLVRMKKVDVIIIKDFSRLSREHLDLCTLIDTIFPFMDVRVISILDNYDSNLRNGEPLELTVAFKAILNEFHVIQTSEKINQLFEMKMQKGEFTSGSLPFGYRWMCKGKPEIVDSEAEIVRFIFDLRLQGNATTKIAEILNKNNVILPNRNIKNRLKLWRSDTVTHILRNPSYMGTHVYRRIVSDMKTKKARFTDKSE